jgi:Outer membrane protein beta-barrel domain
VKTLTLITGLMATTSALADTDSGAIFGLGMGQQKLSVEGTDFDTKAGTWKLFAGWRFNRYLGIEAALVNPEETTDEIASTGIKAVIDSEVRQASLVATWPLHERVSLYARPSMNWYKVDGDFTFEGETILSTHDDGSHLGWGAGVAALWDNALVRLEWEQLDVDLVDTRMLSLSIAWRL